MVYIYTMECYSATKRNEILPLQTTWMDLEGTMLKSKATCATGRKAEVRVNLNSNLITHLNSPSEEQGHRKGLSRNEVLLPLRAEAQRCLSSLAIGQALGADASAACDFPVDSRPQEVWPS